MRLLKKTLLLAHRYLGIAISLLVVVWFLSGIVMMYAGGMPRISAEERYERMAAVDLTKIQLSPADAAERAAPKGRGGRGGPGAPGGRAGGGGRATLLTVQGRPAYRVGAATIFADTGERMEKLDVEKSRIAAGEFLGLPLEKIRLERTLDKSIDQWTLGQSRQLPIHKFAADDGEGTEVYVQPQTGEVIQRTTTRTRTLAWLGTIPHWLYFAALRENQPLWYKIVVWTSGAACVLAVLGLALGALLFRRPQPFTLSAAIPYRGWMRWHYITGMVFGFFTLTWAFSGLLSMEPFDWTRAPGLALRGDIFNGGPADLKQFPAMDPVVWSGILQGSAIKQVSYTRINGELYFDVQHAASDPLEEKKRERLHQPYYVTGAANRNRLLVSAASLIPKDGPIPEETLIQKLRKAAGDVPVVEQQMLTEYDSYYYSRGRQTPLPVLRVKFGDPAETWVYVDPEMGQMLAAIPRLARVERWLYNGLHSLDFPFWYDKRPLWDIGMLTLLGGGLISSMIGLVLGVGRLVRAVPKVSPVRSMAPVPVAMDEPRT